MMSSPVKEANINVSCRLRPFSEIENQVKTTSVIETDADTKTVSCKDQSFTFDNVFPPHSDQLSVYNKVARQYVQDLMDGYNGCLIMYGTTGSGKSYTLHGEYNWKEPQSPGQISKNGILPRFVIQLFENIKELPDDRVFKISLACYEIYNGNVRDLLTKQCKTIEINFVDKTAKMKEVTQQLVYSVKDFFRTLDEATDRRIKIHPKKKDISPRSHFFIDINYECTMRDVRISSKMLFVDLAGSERPQNPANAQEDFKSAFSSFIFLYQMVNLWKTNTETLILPENSLVQLLTGPLNGNFRTSIIVTLSPCFLARNNSIHDLVAGKNFSALKTQISSNIEPSPNVWRDKYLQLKKREKSMKGFLTAAQDELQLWRSGYKVSEMERVQIAPLPDNVVQSLIAAEINDQNAKLTRERINEQLRSEIRCLEDCVMRLTALRERQKDLVTKIDAKWVMESKTLDHDLEKLGEKIQEKKNELNSVKARVNNNKEGAAMKELCNRLAVAFAKLGMQGQKIPDPKDTDEMVAVISEFRDAIPKALDEEDLIEDMERNIMNYNNAIKKVRKEIDAVDPDFRIKTMMKLMTSKNYQENQDDYLKKESKRVTLRLESITKNLEAAVAEKVKFERALINIDQALAEQSDRLHGSGDATRSSMANLHVKWIQAQNLLSSMTKKIKATMEDDSPVQLPHLAPVVEEVKHLVSKHSALRNELRDSRDKCEEIVTRSEGVERHLRWDHNTLPSEVAMAQRHLASINHRVNDNIEHNANGIFEFVASSTRVAIKD